MNMQILKNIFISSMPVVIPVTAAAFLYMVISNQKNRFALKYYSQYIPVLDDMIEQITASQHGYSNIFNSICSLPLIIDDYETLNKALSNYADILQNACIPSHFLLLNNKLLAGLLFQKYCQAESQGIKINVNISDPLCKSRADEFEIVDICGIMIDNALENSKTGDSIFITIGQFTQNDACFHFIVENPGPPADDNFIKNIFTKGYTTKKINPKKHGKGLQILKRTANKYSGIISVYNTYRCKEGRVFTADTPGTQRFLCIDIIV